MFQQFLGSLEFDERLSNCSRSLASCADRVISHLEVSGRTNNVTMSWLDEACAGTGFNRHITPGLKDSRPAKCFTLSSGLCSNVGDCVPEPDDSHKPSSGLSSEAGDSFLDFVPKSLLEFVREPERTPEPDGPPEIVAWTSPVRRKSTKRVSVNFDPDQLQEETGSSVKRTRTLSSCWMTPQRSRGTTNDSVGTVTLHPEDQLVDGPKRSSSRTATCDSTGTVILHPEGLPSAFTTPRFVFRPRTLKGRWRKSKNQKD